MSRLAHVYGVLALCLVTARASAHVPLPRAIAVSVDSAGIALALPGFGVLLRTGAEPSFAYACDAMLGVPPSDAPPMLQYFADGSWLMGSRGGLHTFDANGCEVAPAHVTLGRSPISAIAIHSQSQAAYAVAAGYSDGIWRSDDRGAHWQRTGAIAAADQVTALLVDPADAARLYVSTDAELAVTHDSGASLQTFPQERPVRLLAVQASGRLWAVARALDNRGNRGFDVLRAEGPDQPWQNQLRVNYFGGLAITDNGAIWVGDEGGGVYRSTDQGESFALVESPRSVSCLASAGDRVWACTPALPTSPTLSLFELGANAFVPSITLAEVETRATCAEQSADTCQAAWVEWQRDVLGRPAASIELPLEAGQPSDTPTEDAGVSTVDAPPPAAASPTPAGCTVTQNPHEGSAAAWWLIPLLGLAIKRRRHGLK
jgi:photosystem II stability/assembly factor-like uncharacterized protein